jgi:hypothetical protein
MRKELEAGLRGGRSLRDDHGLGWVEREVCEFEDIYHNCRSIGVGDLCEDRGVHESVEGGDFHFELKQVDQCISAET